ncbi:hypothetical protein QUB70_26835 [Microcoleus sp. A003_D6]|uniref:hypothetical protein n=1 Tax=Microcoleus sp. A003_D6 TaxID=3055266 RepID=UPI002FD00BC1
MTILLLAIARYFTQCAAESPNLKSKVTGLPTTEYYPRRQEKCLNLTAVPQPNEPLWEFHRCR